MLRRVPTWSSSTAKLSRWEGEGVLWRPFKSWQAHVLVPRGIHCKSFFLPFIISCHCLSMQDWPAFRPASERFFMLALLSEMLPSSYADSSCCFFIRSNFVFQHPPQPLFLHTGLCRQISGSSCGTRRTPRLEVVLTHF